jgi:hypothetical protein
LAIIGRATVAFEPSFRRPVGEAFFGACEPSALPLVGVGQCDSGPVLSLADMRRPDAACRGNDRPAGVTTVFQVRENKVEPSPSVRSRYLLAKDDWRRALADETKHLWPEVTVVGEASAFAGAGERLAGAGAGPDELVGGEAREVESEVPTADSGEQMDALKPQEIVGGEICNGAIVNDAWRDGAGVDEILKPIAGEAINVIIQSPHVFAPSEIEHKEPRKHGRFCCPGDGKYYPA